MHKKIPDIINKGVLFISKQQQKNGGFLSLSSANRNNFTNTKIYSSIFPSTLILSCLCNLEENPNTKRIKNKLIKFLLTQKSDNWSFNYWARNAKENKTLPYPDDLDDTFCALSALSRCNSELINGESLAKIVSLLTFAEEKEGGPYHTWLVPPEADKLWRDVDLAVNSNIAYFLSLQDVDLDSITTLTKKAIDNKKYSSPYYPSEYPIIYFISRWYREKKAEKILDFLLSKQKKNGSWGNPLYTALAVSSLINFGVNPNTLEKSIAYLIQTQKSGIWKPYAFCIDPAIKRETYYAGSSALTTAFCTEALAKYLKIKNEESPPEDKLVVINKKHKTSIGEQDKIYNTVVKKAKQRFSTLNTDFKKYSLKYLNKTLKGSNGKQIVLTPYLFKTALGKKGSVVSNVLIIELGLVNLYGWMAYTIYDDFLDEEGDPKILSVANICLRELSLICENIAHEHNEFGIIFKKIMDNLDSANAWETSNCRCSIKNGILTLSKPLPDYGDYSKIADRSLGHALGALAILSSLGFTLHSKEMQNTLAFFKHYIIAKQLNDDAHDWEDDLKAGQISVVCARLLKYAHKKNISLSIKPDDLPKLQSLFWNNIIDEVCKEVLHHTTLARQFIARTNIIVNKKPLEDLISAPEYSAQKAMREKIEMLKFLRAY